MPQRTIAFCNAQIRDAQREFALISLSPRERDRCQGKWFASAKDFAGRAADARDRLDGFPAMHCVPYTGADMRAQAERVTRLEYAQHYYRGLLKEVDDTLLQERAALYRMATGVLRCAEAIQRVPYQLAGASQGERVAVRLGIKDMRREFDKRNKKISKTKRARAAASAPEAPLPPEEASAPPVQGAHGDPEVSQPFKISLDLGAPVVGWLASLCGASPPPPPESGPPAPPADLAALPRPGRGEIDHESGTVETVCKPSVRNLFSRPRTILLHKAGRFVGWMAGLSVGRLQQRGRADGGERGDQEQWQEEEEGPGHDRHHR